MKHILRLVITALLIQSCTTSKEAIYRNPAQTGDFGKAFADVDTTKASIFIKFTVQNTFYKNNKVIKTEVTSWSPCPLGYIDLLYNKFQASGGSCENYDLDQNTRFLTAVKVVYSDIKGYSSELSITNNDDEQIISNRLESYVNLSKAFYHKFETNILLKEYNEKNKKIRRVLKAVEIAQSRYFEKGLQPLQQVDFDQIAENYVNSRGGLDNLAKELIAENIEKSINECNSTTTYLNSRFKIIKKYRKIFSDEEYKKLYAEYMDLAAQIDKNWETILRHDPKLIKRRLKLKNN